MGPTHTPPNPNLRSISFFSFVPDLVLLRPSIPALKKVGAKGWRSRVWVSSQDSVLYATGDLYRKVRYQI